MSYSRWSNSYWYTFWSSFSGILKDNQIFSIVECYDFKYIELKNNVEDCLLKVKCKECSFTTKECIIECNELKTYMEAFIRDVENGEYLTLNINGNDLDIIISHLHIAAMHNSVEILNRVQEELGFTINEKDYDNSIEILNKYLMMKELRK